MSDILETLKKTRDVIRGLYENTSNEELSSQRLLDLLNEIDDAIEHPQLRIPTPKGDLVASVGHNEAAQAWIEMDVKDGPTIDLLLAECPEDELLENYKPDLEEGDVRLLIWSDPMSEDYQKKFVIKASELEELKEQEKEDRE